MNPRHSEKFEEELFDFLEREEKFIPNVYVCSRHVPTIGVGYALLEKNRHTFQIRTDLDSDLAKLGMTLTAADKTRLEKLCRMLNDGSIQQAIIGDRLKDPFDLAIDRNQAKQLFKICIPRYDSVLRNKLGLKLYSKLQNSKEMVGLLSLAYNAPALIGVSLVEAIRQGNRAKIQYQILYGSNKNRDIGLDRRRKREAAEIGRYDSDSPTLQELKAEQEVQQEHAAQMAAYTSQMDAKRKGKTARRAKGMRVASSSQPRGLHAGRNPHQRAVRRRIDEVKAHPANHRILERIQDLWDQADKVIHRDWRFHPASLNEGLYHRRWS